jgi:hypothetical protein
MESVEANNAYELEEISIPWINHHHANSVLEEVSES